MVLKTKRWNSSFNDFVRSKTRIEMGFLPKQRRSYEQKQAETSVSVAYQPGEVIISHEKLLILFRGILKFH